MTETQELMFAVLGAAIAAGLVIYGVLKNRDPLGISLAALFFLFGPLIYLAIFENGSA